MVMDYNGKILQFQKSLVRIFGAIFSNTVVALDFMQFKVLFC